MDTCAVVEEVILDLRTFLFPEEAIFFKGEISNDNAIEITSWEIKIFFGKI